MLLSLVEAPFRDLGVPLLEEVRRYTSSPGTVVTVVIREFVVTRWWEQPLHGQTALFIRRLLLTEPQVTVTNVPYHVPGPTEVEGRATGVAGTVGREGPDQSPLARGGMSDVLPRTTRE